MPNDLKRITVSIRESDHQYLTQLQKSVSDQIGFDVGVSFVLRLIVQFLIRNKIDVSKQAIPEPSSEN